MRLKQFTRIFLFIIVLKGIAAKRRDEQDKRRHGGNNRKKGGEVTDKSLTVLRENTLANKKTLYVDDVIQYTRLPKRTDRLVYRFENNTHIFIGFDCLENGRITEMTWKIKDAKADMVVLENQSISRAGSRRSKDLRQLLTTDVILAAANSRLEKRFKEDMDTCDTTKSITMRYCLLQAFASLANKLKHVTFQESCYKPTVER